MEIPCFSLDRRRFFPNSKYYYYEPDTSHLVTYQHNSFGARSEEYNPDAEFRFITFGASLIFSTGLNQEYTLCSKLKGVFSTLLDLPEEKINGINLGFGGHSNDSLSRFVLDYLDVLEPDIIVCNIVLLGRKEIVYDDTLGSLGSWLLENSCTRTVKAKAYYDFYDESQGVLNLLQNILLIQQHCRVLRIPCIFTSANVIPAYVWEDSRFECYTRHLDRSQFVEKDAYYYRFDVAGDDRHPGEIPNEIYAWYIAEHILNNQNNYTGLELKNTGVEKFSSTRGYMCGEILSQGRKPSPGWGLEKMQREVIAKYPQDYRLYYRLALLFESKDQYDEAEKALLEGIEQTSHWALYLKLARLYLKNQQVNKVLETVKQVTDSNPDDEQFYISLCIFAMEISDLESAYNAIIKAIGKNSAVSEYYRLKSIIELKAGNRALAVKSLETALEVNCYDIELYTSLVKLCGSGNKKYALLNRALEINPAAHDVFMELAEYHKEEGDLQKAVDAVSEAVRLAPTMINIWIILSRYYCLMKDYDSALEALGTCIEKHIEHDSLYYECALILRHTKCYDEAMEAIKYALAMNDSVEAYQQLHDQLAAELSV